MGNKNMMLQISGETDKDDMRTCINFLKILRRPDIKLETQEYTTPRENEIKESTLVITTNPTGPGNCLILLIKLDE